MRTTLFLFLIFQIPFTALSQKSSPVAGDAAILIDLIRKDYDVLDSDLKDEAISKDMFKAISIFRTYMTEKERRKDTLCTVILNKLSDEVKTSVYERIDFCSRTDSLNYYFERYKQTQKIYNYLKENRLLEERSYDFDEDFEESNGTYDEYDYDDDELLNNIQLIDAAKTNYFETKFFFDLKRLGLIKLVYEENGNTYLAYIVEKLMLKYGTYFNGKEDFLAQVNYNSSINKALPFLGGDLTFETIIDGLTRFLVNRIKEELTTHAIDKIQNYLNNPSQESYLNELIVLLPKTTEYLKEFEASQVLNFTDDFKQYIENDLNNLLKNTSKLKTTPRFQKLIERNPDIGFAFEALDLIPQISKIKEPIDYFDIIENSPNLQRWSNNPNNKLRFNIANSISLTSLLAHSLLVIDDGKQKLASLDFMSDYGSEKEFYLLYLGFLNQQNQKYFDVEFVGQDSEVPVSLDFTKLMTDLAPDTLETADKSIQLFKKRLTSIVVNTEKLQQNIENIKRANKNNEKIEINAVHGLVEVLVEFSEEIAITADSLIAKGKEFKFLNVETANFTGKTKPYFKTAKAVNDIFLDLHNKNFTNAIIGALEIPANFANNDISIGKLVDLKSVLDSSKEILLFRDFLTYRKLPKSKNKRNQLKNLAIRFEEVLARFPNGTFPKIESAFESVHKSIKDNKSQDFINQMSGLRKTFLDNGTYKSAFEKYAKIDIDSVFIEPIEKIIDNGVVNDNRKTELKEYLDNFVTAAFKDFVFSDGEDLDKSKQVLLKYFTVYLPEFSNTVFRIKDKNVLRIIHFITDVATAENEEEVESALEAFALPAGSSSVKEETSTYISINAYPGILGGLELSEESNDEDAYHAGITAPIGIYAQFFKVKKGSFGIFIPIIDIGAPVRFRLDDDSNTETLPDFDFKDIFSPGAYISYGFNKVPFALNAGIQYGPKLRDIDNGMGDIRNIEAYRISIGLVIDIPLFAYHRGGLD